MTPDSFTLILSIQLLAGMVIGGSGTLMGAWWGAMALVYVPQWTMSLSGHFNFPSGVSANLQNAVFGLLIIVIMMVAPSGIQGWLRSLGSQLWNRPRHRRATGRRTQRDDRNTVTELQFSAGSSRQSLHRHLQPQPPHPLHPRRDHHMTNPHKDPRPGVTARLGALLGCACHGRLVARAAARRRGRPPATGVTAQPDRARHHDAADRAGGARLRARSPRRPMPSSSM